MNRRQKIIVSITGIILVSLILIGLTYAYFLTKITGNTNDKSISVSTANLVLEYGENTNVVQGISNAEPGYSVEKIFTATNKGNSSVTYGAALEDIVNSLSRQQDLVYTLTCTSYLTEGFSLSSNGTITGTVDGDCSGVTSETKFPSTSTLSIMTTNTIDTTHTHAYKLTVTYKEMGVDQSEDMNKTFSAKVNIVDLAKLTVDNPYKNDSGTLKKAMIDNAMLGLNGTTYTPNLSATGMVDNVSTASNKILSTAEDDYGTSYYFRGNPIDNYVNYAGMCWRIVRIEGDGSIKLILASEKTCSTSNLTDGSGYATDGATGVQGIKLTAHYGYKKVEINHKIINSVNINDYINSAADTTGNARTKLNAWLERKITNESDKALLKNETWCIGDLKNGYSMSNTGEIVGTISDLITAGTSFEYTALNKYYVTKTPSYKCETTGVEGETDTNKVGMLTFDEIIYAGGGNNSNANYYLNNNATTSDWWTISSSRYYSQGPENIRCSVFFINGNGYVNDKDVDNIWTYSNGVYYYTFFRPVIALTSSTKISGGNGTISNPYVVD